MTTKKQSQHYNCSDIEKMVQAYLDQQLQGEDLKSFEDHLEYCLPCEKKVEFDRKLKDVIKLKLKESTKSAELNNYLKNLLSGKNENQSTI